MAKWVSSVATYRLQNGHKTVITSPTKRKILTKSPKVCLLVSSVLVVYLLFLEIVELLSQI